MADNEEQRHRRDQANEIANMLNEFSAGVVDNFVDENTMVFDNKAEEEELQRLKDEQEKAEVALATTSKNSAQELIDSALQLYAKKTGDISYVKFKAKSDVNAFGKILQQIEINEDAIREIMRDIKLNGPNPNLMRCLSDLQKTEIELLKIRSQYLQEIEQSRKQVSSDVEMSEAVELESEEETTSAKIRGQRDLMIMLEQAKKDSTKQITEITNQENNSGNEDTNG